jgi:flagellar basal-body rod protein FlgB
MSQDLTVDAVRMALSLNKLKAEVTSWNIANTSSPDAPVFVIDQSRTDRVLNAAAGASPDDVAALLRNPDSPTLAIVDQRYDRERASLDDLVAESVSAGLNYQALTESLSRHFGLMRLAVTGRSGA